MVAMPDPSTFAVLPWRPEEQGVGAHVLRRPDARAHAVRGRPAPRAAPRARARARRWASTRFNVGPELEYFLFKDKNGTEVLDEGGYFDLTTLDAGSDVRRETVLALEQLGIHVEYSHHEVGPSQHEVDMRYADALKMADDCMTYRITVKEYAMKYGWHATFMPKPLFGENGSGMHTHMSLFKDGDERVLRRRRPLLPVRRRQGVHRRPAAPRARDVSSIFAQWVNSYKRLVPGLRGAGLRRLVAAQPLARSCACRSTTPGKEQATRMELRCPDPAVQPVPDVRGAAAGRARGHREGLRAARADGEEPLPPGARRPAPARASSSCPRRSARRSS